MTAPKLIAATAVAPRTIDIAFDQAMDGPSIKQLSSYSIVPSLPGFELSSVTAVNSSTARIQLKASMLDAGEYTVTVSEVRNKDGEELDPAFASVEFIGVGSRPEAQSAQALDASTIRVVFSEPVDPTTLAELQNFELVSDSTGKAIPLSASTPIGEGNGLVKKTNLTISQSSKMTDGGTHTLTVTGIKGAAGTPQQTASIVSFVGIASLPRVLSVEFDEINNAAIVTFDSPIQRAGASALGSYAILSQPGVPQLYHDSIAVAADRLSASIKLSDARQGAPYLLAVSEDVTDDFANPIDQAQNSGAFVAIGTVPELVMALPQGTNRLDLIFSKPLRDSAAVRDESRYAATGGLAIVKVLDVKLETIKLATSDQIPGASYTITIS